MFFGRAISLHDGGGWFPQSSPMILAPPGGTIFGEYLPEKKTQALKLQIQLSCEHMFQNFQMDASCAHFWDFFLVLLTMGEKNFWSVPFSSAHRRRK